MVQQVVSFRTSDGKVFTSEIEANGHEKYLQIKPQIDGFIEAAGLKKASAGFARNIIPAFLAHAGM